MTKLTRLLGPSTRRFLVAVVWGFINTALFAVLSPLALKYLFDEGIAKQNFRLFIAVGVGSLVAFTVLRVSELLYNLFAQRLKNIVLSRTVFKMLRSYFSFPYREILRRGEGYFVSRIYDESKSATEPVTDTVLGVVQATAMITGGGVIVLALSWQLTAVVAAVTFVLLYESSVFGRRILRQSSVEQEEEARLRAIVTDMTGAYKTARMFNLVERGMTAVATQLEPFQSVLYERFKTAKKYNTLSGIFLSWAELAVVIGGGYAVLVGSMTFGGFMAFMNAYWVAVNGLRQLVESIPALSQLGASIDRVLEFEGQVVGSRHPDLVSTDGTIRLEHIDFKYDDKPVLNDFSVQVHEGERVMLVGSNGSGKSTVANIIAGFLQPDSGNMQLPRTISAVVEPVSFPPVPLEAMLPEEKREEALRLAAAFEIDDHLSRRHDDLSLGQRRKWAVLMALLKPAQCYVLDEPLANLDGKSRSLVIDIIFERTRGKTLIAIMHEGEEFADRFDRVVQMPAVEAQGSA